MIHPGGEGGGGSQHPRPRNPGPGAVEQNLCPVANMLPPVGNNQGNRQIQCQSLETYLDSARLSKYFLLENLIDFMFEHLVHRLYLVQYHKTTLQVALVKTRFMLKLPVGSAGALFGCSAGARSGCVG